MRPSDRGAAGRDDVRHYVINRPGDCNGVSGGQEHGLMFCREDGTPLDRWHVRKEFQKITRAARLGGA